MTNIVPLGESSPFDAIRKYREDGTEYWEARDVLHLLDLNYLMSDIPKWERDKFQLQTNKIVLTSEDLGFLLLELSAFLVMQNNIEYVRDAFWLLTVTHSIYRGQSATALFCCVHSQATQRINSLSNEFTFHRYIQLFWKELFPFATKITHEYVINKKLKVDFLLNDSIPVEVKKDGITRECINQLLRYMEGVSSKKGYLIASSCDVALPSNVTFIRLTLDEINTKLVPSYIPLKSKLTVRVREIQSAKCLFS